MQRKPRVDYQQYFPVERDAFIASLPRTRVCTRCSVELACSIDNFGVRVVNGPAALARREKPRFHVQAQCRACRARRARRDVPDATTGRVP